MNYKDTIDFLFSQLPMYQRTGKLAYKANLDNTIAFDKHLNMPHKSFKTIHVAGTNGKGSVSHSLASVLHQAGYKVGLYTSPHMKDFRERIKINGNCISENEVCSFVENNKGFIEDIQPSFFEMCVAMAFNYFAQQNVDIAIIEVGLGGRLDSTNIITPICSIITNISLDHTALLGDTIEKIATEKAGIIKPNIPVVIGETSAQTQNVFLASAKSNDAPIYFAQNYYSAKWLRSNNLHQTIKITNKTEHSASEIDYDLLGSYQTKNICTVLKSIDVIKNLGVDISNNDVENGLKNVIKNTSLRGRWEILETSPLCICDIGHNYDGVKNILMQLSECNYNTLHIVWGMVNDKDISNILKLLPKDAKYYFTQANIPRALPAKELQNMANEVGLNGDSFTTVENAIKFAKKNTHSNDLIFIGGSTFVVAEAL